MKTWMREYYAKRKWVIWGWVMLIAFGISLSLDISMSGGEWSMSGVYIALICIGVGLLSIVPEIMKGFVLPLRPQYWPAYHITVGIVVNLFMIYVFYWMLSFFPNASNWWWLLLSARIIYYWYGKDIRKEEPPLEIKQESKAIRYVIIGSMVLLAAIYLYLKISWWMKG
ncbi:MAG: hypothetical protein IPP77_11625 [Bacteroidetes bacterium]|nr:hypothetical protein [Bacteroidota bacterium]